jgi:hypothetical protein
MSGILDSKSRVMDTILTQEGRSQLATANLDIKYISFTDVGVYYAADVVSGSSDATTRIYFESCNAPQDQVTLEANDAGLLTNHISSDGQTISNGQIISYSELLTGSQHESTIETGQQFASLASQVLESSLDNFSKLRTIATNNHIFEDDGFDVGNKNIEFVITDTRPISDSATFVTHLNSLESLYQDVRMSNVANFKYLPPINKIDNSSLDTSDYRNTANKQLGNYPSWGRTHVDGLQPKQLESELQVYEKIGTSKVVVFEPTSINNALVGQFFEIGNGLMTKLDVIDYGQYTWNGQKKHTFFVGKIMTDDNGANTFIHNFTLVFG